MRDKNHFCIAQFSLVFSLVCFSVVSCKFLSTSKSSMIKYFCVQSYPHWPYSIKWKTQNNVQKYCSLSGYGHKNKSMFQHICWNYLFFFYWETIIDNATAVGVSIFQSPHSV